MGNSPAGAFPQLGAGRHRLAAGLSEDADDVQVAATEIFSAAGVGAYHTSIVIGNREYYFDSQGIESAPPFWSHACGSDAGLNVEVFKCGKSALTGRALLKGLTPFFEEGTYDIIFKNCNHFTAAALYFLTRSRLDPRFSRLERALASTSPLSTGLINSVVRAAAPSAGCKGGPRQQWQYVTNPRAKGFSVEAVMSACDALDSEAPAASRHSGWGFASMTSTACCSRLCAESEKTAVVVIPTGMDEQPTPPSPSRRCSGTSDAELAAELAELEAAGAPAGSERARPASSRPDSSGSETSESSEGERPRRRACEPSPARRAGQRRQLPI